MSLREAVKKCWKGKKVTFSSYFFCFVIVGAMSGMIKRQETGDAPTTVCVRLKPRPEKARGHSCLQNPSPSEV